MMLGIPNAISKGPWTRPLNWNLQVTLNDEPCLPFAHYVQLEPTRSSFPPFPQFSALPTELQLRILRLCDSPTLFRLMQVSSTVRVVAKKLFWSYPDVWYRVKADWLLAGGFPGYAHYAIDILPYVEQVEVNFDTMDSLHRDREAEICADHLGVSRVPLQGVEGRIRDFWQTLQYRFPRATNVVVSESMPRREATELLPNDLKMTVEMCPDSIRVSASFLKRAAGKKYLQERSLWRQAKGDFINTGGWQQVTSTWMRQSIILPPKEFRGPVGAYDCYHYRFYRYSRLSRAAKLLLVEAVERHHFHQRRKSFDCFEPDCKAHFKEPGEWTLHALDNLHTRNAVVPDELKVLFDCHKSLLQQTYRHDGTWDRIIAEFGEEGSEKRHNAEQAFLHQLDHDPLYAHGKPARECSTWYSYTTDMDPTYVYR